MNDDPTQDLPTEVVALIQGISVQLSALQNKVDERLYDTRPLWESVQSQINELRFEMEQAQRELHSDMEAGFREVRAESKAEVEKLRTELSRELRHVSNSLDALHGKMLRFDTIQRDDEDRVRDLESKGL